MKKRFFFRAAAILLVLTLVLPSISPDMLRILFRPASAANAGGEIPPAFSLGGDSLGEMRTSGLWQYACRQTDGYAVITSYSGRETSVTVPAQLDGIDVVGIASGALPGCSVVRLHGNILYIADDAFGSSEPQIISLNGTYGLYWASEKGLSLFHR